MLRPGKNMSEKAIMMLCGFETDRAVPPLRRHFSDLSDFPVAEIPGQSCGLVPGRTAVCSPVAAAVRIAGSDPAFRQSCTLLKW